MRYLITLTILCIFSNVSYGTNTPLEAEHQKRPSSFAYPAAKRQNTKAHKNTTFQDKLIQTVEYKNGSQNGLNDAQANHYLSQARTGENLSPQDHKEALFYLAEMRYRQSTNTITDEEAVEYFLKLHNDETFNRENGCIPTYYMALMSYKKRTNRITREKAAEFFKELSTNPFTTNKLKSLSRFWLASLQVNITTNVISDETAAQYFDELRTDQNIDAFTKESAAFNLAMMYHAKRTSRIDSHQACEYLESALHSDGFSSNLKDIASNAIIDMTYGKLPAAIPAPETVVPSRFILPRPVVKPVFAPDMSLKIPPLRSLPSDENKDLKYLNLINSPDTAASDLSHAQYKLAEMRYEKNTNVIDDNQAAGYLVHLLESGGQSKTTMRRITFYLAGLRVRGHTNKIDDIEATQYLSSIIENQSIKDEIKDISIYYMALMRLHNRTDKINDEDARQYFKFVLASDLIDAPMKVDVKKQLAQLSLRMPQNTPSELTYMPMPKLQPTLIPNEAAPQIPVAAPALQKDRALELLKIRKSDNATTSQIKAAEFELARMRAFNRTNIINDKKAMAYLGSFISFTKDKYELSKAIKALDIIANRI